MTAVKYLRNNIISLRQLSQAVDNCDVCKKHLPFHPKPIIQISEQAHILIIGQAPGLAAHESNTPWNDKSGERLRGWLDVDADVFYNDQQLAILPMGFCFPGYKNKADAPPRPECAPLWHNKFISLLKPALTLLIGRYAQQYYLPEYKTLTDAVQKHHEQSNNCMVLPHPSGRNNRWLRNNPWFEDEILPELKNKVSKLI